MKELKVGDEVVDGSGIKGKVIGILTETPKGYVGPVCIAIKNSSKYSALIYRDVYGKAYPGNSGNIDFKKVVKKEKIKLFLNIYKNNQGYPSVCSHVSEDAAKSNAGSTYLIGLAVPYEYEYEVED